MSYNKFDLITSIQAGEDRVLRYFYKKYHAAIFGYAKRKFPAFDYSEIEEIYNDAWMILYDNIKAGKIKIVDGQIEPSTFVLVAYLKRIVFNLLMTKWRAKEKRKKAEQAAKEVEKINAIEDNLDEDLLQRAFCQLKHRWQRLMYYRLVMTLEYDFIAEILPAANGSVVKSEMWRARKKLQAIYKDLSDF